MPTAIAVLVLVLVMPYLLAFLGGYLKVRQLGRLDNENPRLQSLQLSGSGARAVAAQSNAWEALAFYIGTLLVVSLAGVPLEAVATPALVFAVSRILHPVLYIANLATLRSIVFIVGFASCIYMVAQAF